MRYDVVEYDSLNSQIGGEQMECPMANDWAQNEAGTVIDCRARNGADGDEKEGGRRIGWVSGGTVVMLRLRKLRWPKNCRWSWHSHSVTDHVKICYRSCKKSSTAKLCIIHCNWHCTSYFILFFSHSQTMGSPQEEHAWRACKQRYTHQQKASRML